MKIVKEILLSLVLTVVVFGLTASAAAKKANVQDNLNKVVDSYTAIHALLAADKADGVPAAAAKLIAATDAALAAAKDASVKNALNEIKSKAAALNAKGITLESARDKFGPLSEAVIALVRDNFPEKLKGKYAINYCSMADKHWLQKDKQLKNPYYGKSMLGCGEKVGYKHKCKCKDKDKEKCKCKDKENCKCKDKGNKDGHGKHGDMGSSSLKPVEDGPKCEEHKM